jgi:NAD(P)-dependent dehydrogenase (short-subunit alcohol dehydrogenase family)
MRITTPIYDVPLWTRIDGAIAVKTSGARGFGHAVVLSLVDAGASIAIADLDVAAFDVIVSGPDFGSALQRSTSSRAESCDHDPRYTALSGMQSYPVPLGALSFEDRVVNRAHEALLSYS